jgi:peptidoglycan/LPS O-acetylase OafA/YrhL
MSRARADSARNNFDVLRLAAAAAVLVSHAFLLTDRNDPVLSVGRESLGDLAVTAFFGMSGFLVARSWCREPRLGRFAAKRGLRILPGLWVVVLLAALALGPLMTTLGPGSYFTSGTTRGYVLGNLAMHTQLYLPGVFGANPHPSVNGSLWTLPMELEAYLAVAVLGAIGAFRRRWTIAVVAGGLLAADAFALAPSSLAHVTVNRLAAFFVAALLYVWSDRGILRWPVLGAAAVAFVAALGSSVELLVGAVTIPYLVVWLAYRTPAGLGRLVRRGDLSYGIYLYGWPVEQTVRAVGGSSVGPVEALVVAAPVTYLLALASWRLVEAPALRLKGRALRSGAAPALALAEQQR